MDQEAVREHAAAHCAALLAGEVDRAVADFSPQLRSNLGPLIAQLPLPLTAATVESVEPGASSYVVILRLVGEGQEVRLETRWKERDGRPTIVEESHIVEHAAAEAPSGEPGEPEP
jgi:hypothetical protein